MGALFDPVDWSRLFVPGTPLLETVLRGSCVYLGLFVLMRVVFRRESGAPRISMLLLIVLLADAIQNAMADDYTSVTDGLILVATLMAWDYALDWTASRVPALAALLHPRPLLLVRGGRMLHGNMRRELVSEQELWTGLRQQGVRELDEVEKAYMEADGRLSVFRREPRAGRRRSASSSD
jgi:uncharacterized membrane protein YcaP (DUF421 family)